MATVEQPVWIIDGRRVELERGPLFTRVLVDGAALSLRIPPVLGEHSFQVGARQVVLEVCQPRPARRWSFALRVDGAPVEGCPAPADRIPVPDGARCPAHPERTAELACVRCGRFACRGCAGYDGATCQGCFALVHAGSWVPGPRRSPTADSLTALATGVSALGVYLAVLSWGSGTAPPLLLAANLAAAALALVAHRGDQIARWLLRRGPRALELARAVDLGLPAAALLVALACAGLTLAALLASSR